VSATTNTALLRARPRVAAAAAALGCLVLGAAPAAAPARTALVSPLAVVTSRAPASIAFGDPVTAVLEIHYAAAIAPSSLRIAPSFDPFVQRAQPAVQLVHAGVVRVRYSLLCLSDACLSTHGARLVPLGSVTVTGRARSGTVSAVGRWPTVRVSSRLAPSALSGKARFHVPAALPAPGYRIAPGELEIVLIAAAVLCAATALMLVTPSLRPRRRRALRESRLSALELAIAYVRDSRTRPDPERRRALELLSEIVESGGVDPGLAAASARRAWSRHAPTPEDATDFAERAGALSEDQS
jgi:alkylhydroperoxidase family enzyme